MVTMIYQGVIFNYPPFLKGGRGDYKTFRPRENVDLDTFAEVSTCGSGPRGQVTPTDKDSVGVKGIIIVNILHPF